MAITPYTGYCIHWWVLSCVYSIVYWVRALVHCVLGVVYRCTDVVSGVPVVTCTVYMV